MAIMPIMHPAAILRGNAASEPDQLVFLRRALAYVRGDFTPIDLDGPLPPNAILNPTLADLAEWRSDEHIFSGVALDIESAGPHIICVGLMRIWDEGYVCLRFRTQGGAFYWRTWREMVAAVEWLGELLANRFVPKVMQNGQAFDVIELTKLGFVVEGFEFDTMLAAGCCRPGAPRDLQTQAIVRLGFPAWKSMVRDEDEPAEGK
jgi:hypothetical protein